MTPLIKQLSEKKDKEQQPLDEREKKTVKRINEILLEAENVEVRNNSKYTNYIKWSIAKIDTAIEWLK